MSKVVFYDNQGDMLLELICDNNLFVISRNIRVRKRQLTIEEIDLIIKNLNIIKNAIRVH